MLFSNLSPEDTCTHEKLLMRKKGRKRVLFAQIQKGVNCATRNVLSLSLSLSLSQTLSPRAVVGALFIFCGACSHSVRWFLKNRYFRVLVDFTKQKGKRGVSQRLRERYLSIGIPRRREREREKSREGIRSLLRGESQFWWGERLEKERDGGGVKRARDVFFIPRIGRRREC